jgi:hypothetical protein
VLPQGRNRHGGGWASLLEGGRETGEFEADELYLGGGGASWEGIRKNREKLPQKGAYASNQEQIPKKPVAYTEGWKGYGDLVVNGYDHYRVFHSRNEFVR